MTTPDLKQLVQRLVQQQSERQPIRLVSPRRDWLVGLAIGTLILLISGLFSVYTYVSYRYNSTTTASSEPIDVPAYRAAVVADALTYIEQRAAQFDTNTAASGPSVITPVIESPVATTSTSVATTTADTVSTTTELTPSPDLILGTPELIE